ncbi:claudin-4-like [Misgurnus anguillicaudatus]|uniref:claudin-4-like n=1 Tax=Misgurnus anguillicaudatus TaxID=75329 RepID=UPI003CCF5493
MQVVKSKILGLSLAILGWIGAIGSCALPMWKVSVRVKTGQTIWEGIWERCEEDSTEEMQCEIHDYMTLSSDLQAAGALCIVVIVMGVLGIYFFIRGAKCTGCVKEERAKARVMFAAGGTFICAAVLLLIPVCWAAYSTIWGFLNDFRSDSYIDKFPKEIGASLYLGWASSALLFGGGTILCCNCLPDKVIKKVIKHTGEELMSQANL